MSAAPIIQCEDITVWRGETQVLDAVSMIAQAGEVWQVTGPNGSGKTTLLRVLAGLGLPDEGEVSWHGKPIHSVRSEFNADLVYLGHKAAIAGDLTARENLAAYLDLRQQHPNHALLDSTLAKLKLGDRVDLPCRWLSAGQQRRVALARLALEPASLWILDEPLNALDSDAVDWVVAAIQDQASRFSNRGELISLRHRPRTASISKHRCRCYLGVSLVGDVVVLRWALRL